MVYYAKSAVLSMSVFKYCYFKYEIISWYYSMELVIEIWKEYWLKGKGRCFPDSEHGQAKYLPSIIESEHGNTKIIA